MWASNGGIADNLSREFRTMSTTRDRRWGAERGAYRAGDAPSPLLNGTRATSPPLRYGSSERRRYEEYQPIRRYAQGEALSSRGGVYEAAPSSSRAKSRGAGDLRREIAVAPSGHGRSSRAPARSPQYGGGGSRSRSAGRYRRDEDDKDDDGSSSYSYSYSYSDTASDSEDSVRSGEHRRPRRVDRLRPPPPRAVRYTPTGPSGATHAGDAVHWVGDEAPHASHRADPNRAAPLPPRAATDMHGSRAVARNATEPRRPVVTAQMPELQPSGLLRRVIEAVAYYRGVPVPSTIPSEVTLAFDEYVSRGSTMLKFLPHGPPHARFFILRFLDVVPGGKLRGKGAGVIETTTPHAVLSWYKNTSSRHMIRFLPLHDLLEVKADGTDHPYVQRRTVQPGVLRGPRSGLSTNYVYADHILQFRFRSRLSRGEETLALKTANRTQYLAWLVVGSFISQVGSEGERPFH